MYQNKKKVWSKWTHFLFQFWYRGFILFYLGSIVKCTEIAAFGLKPSHAKEHILGGKNQTLNSTLKVSSVQDKKQCDPEAAAAKGKTTWGKWAMRQEQQKP